MKKQNKSHQHSGSGRVSTWSRARLLWYYLVIVPIYYTTLFAICVLVISHFRGLDLGALTLDAALRWLAVIAIICWTGAYLIHAREIWMVIRGQIRKGGIPD